MKPNLNDKYYLLKDLEKEDWPFKSMISNFFSNLLT